MFDFSIETIKSSNIPNRENKLLKKIWRVVAFFSLRIVMKIRTITIGIHLSQNDFELKDGELAVAKKLAEGRAILSKLEAVLISHDYEVQTIRMALNSFEEWNPSLNMDFFETIDRELASLIVDLCAIGSCSSIESIHLLPEVLNRFPRFSSSVHFPKTNPNEIAPDFKYLLPVAECCLRIADNAGDLGNFRFCASFNCPPDVPFFPAAYNDNEDGKFSISIGLESGDLLFLAFFGADSLAEAQSNLKQTLFQALSPIESIVSRCCEEGDGTSVLYKGIDASLNPGLSLPDSIGSVRTCCALACCR